MKITVIGADGKKRKIALPSKATIQDLAAKANFSSQAFLFCKNGVLCLESEQLREGDEIRLVRVISGG